MLCAIIASATPTNPQVSNTLAEGTPRYRDYVTTRGYSLSKVTMYKGVYIMNNESALNGMKLQWNPDSGIGDPITILYGSDTDD